MPGLLHWWFQWCFYFGKKFCDVIICILKQLTYKRRLRILFNKTGEYLGFAGAQYCHQACSTLLAEQNEFPHQARLQIGNEVCGATVYNKDYVLTAAHCVIDENGNLKNPRNGYLVIGTNAAQVNAPQNVFPIERIIAHERYSLRRNNPEFINYIPPGKRIYNDIALLKLGRSINFAQGNPYIRALEIAPANFRPEYFSNKVVIVGWGTSSNNLLKANLIIHRDDDCFKPLLAVDVLPYPNTREFSEQLLCVGGLVNGQFSPMSGKGDSGGPAICRGYDGNAVHCGILSFGGDGDACSRSFDATSCKPSAYADVSYFRNWIRNIAGGQEPWILYRIKLFGDSINNNQAVHQIHVFSQNGASCGGTLVSPDVVVTAGHCVFNDNKSVRPGVQVVTRHGQRYYPRNGGVVGYHTFQRYSGLDNLNNRRSSRSFLQSPYVDDIAIIKLNGRAPYGAQAYPKIPRSLPHGWFDGYELSYPLVNQGFSQNLINRQFRIMSQWDCQQRLNLYRALGGQVRFDVSKMLCGVERYSGGSTCDREVGGGLICKDGGGDVLCGVQTFRHCDGSLPSHFASVVKYLNLIDVAMRAK